MTPTPLTAYRPIAQKIDGVRRSEERAHVVTGVINAVAGLVAIFTLVTLLEHLFRFETTGRAFLFWGGGLLAVVVTGRALIEPLGRLLGFLSRQSQERIAGRVGLAIPAVGDRLLNVVQLHEQIRLDRNDGTSLELAGASILRSAESLLDHDFGAIIDAGQRRRSLFLLFSSTLILLSVGLLSGGEIIEAWERIVDNRTVYQAPAPFTLTLLPGDVEVERGESVEVEVRVEGIPPLEIEILTEGVESGRSERLQLEQRETGLYTMRLGDLRESLRYHAEGAGISTASYTITLVERPDIRNLQIRLLPPAYSRLERRTLPVGEGHLSGLRGTRASITAETTEPVASAEIIQILPSLLLPGLSRVDTLRLPMSVNGTRITGGFPLLRNGEYQLSVTSPEGRTARSASYSIAVTDDRPPSITLLQPKLGLDVDESNLIPVQVAINDDFGFSQLRIRYRLVSSRYDDPWSEARSQRVALPTYNRTDLEVPYLWDITGERFMPEDEIEAWVEVADNDPFAGPKWAKTNRFLLRYPSFDEILAETESQRQEASSGLQNVMREAEEARREMERMNRELARQLNARQQKAGRNESRELKEMIRKHEEMQGRLREVAENLKEVVEALRKTESISPETLREYRELQKLFESIESPDLRRSMERLAEEMEKMSPQEMIEAMKELEFNEKEFRKSLERARERLEGIKRAEDIARLAERAARLAEDQNEVNRQPSEQRQKELAEKAEKLQRDAALMQRKSAKEPGSEEMNRAGEELAREDPAGAMKRSASEIAENRPDKARPHGERAEKSLEKFSKEMKDLAEEMSRNRNAERADRMKKSLKDLLDIAKKQEELQKRTSSTPSGGEEMKGQAREQADLKRELENLVNETGSPEKPSFVMTPQMAKELGDAMSRMADAQKGLEGRQSQKAAADQGKAVAAMSKAAGEMAGQLESMGEGKGEGGEGGDGKDGSGGTAPSLRSQIQKLAAQQQALSMAMRENGSGSEGESGSGGSGGSRKGETQEGMSGRLGREQREIGKSLAELAREARESGGGRRQSVADELERAAEQINEVLADVANGEITPEREERQDRILSRLLDALRSGRERDYDEQRESSSGTDLRRTSPNGPDGNPPGTEQNPRLPSVESAQGYAPEYRELIRRYLESIE